MVINIMLTLVLIQFTIEVEEVDADIVLYGHTHIPMIKHEGDMLIMNPGSVSSGRGVKFRMSIGYLKIVKNQPVEAIL